MPNARQPLVVHISTIQINAEAVVDCLRQAGFEAVEVCDGSRAGLKAIEDLQPDLVTIGVVYPEPPHRPFTLCREIIERWPEMRVILVQMEADDDFVQADAAIVGASACLPVTLSCDDLVATCRAVLSRTTTPLGPDLRRSVLGAEGLTPRQLDVLRLAAADMPAREIADDLGIALNTVRVHERAIREKIHVTSIPAAVERARRLGIV